MKEVTYLIRGKGQKLVNQLQTSNMFARMELEKGASEERTAILNAEIRVRQSIIKEVTATFELDTD